MKIIALLLVLNCSGHTNAKCVPSIQEFDTIELCEKARDIPEGIDLFGFGKSPPHKNEYSVCFLSVKN